MHTVGLTTANEHEAKATSVSEDNAEESSQGYKTAAINWTAVTKSQEGVNSDKENGDDDEVQVVIDIL